MKEFVGKIQNIDMFPSAQLSPSWKRGRTIHFNPNFFAHLALKTKELQSKEDEEKSKKKFREKNEKQERSVSNEQKRESKQPNEREQSRSSSREKRPHKEKFREKNRKRERSVSSEGKREDKKPRKREESRLDSREKRPRKEKFREKNRKQERSVSNEGKREGENSKKRELSRSSSREKRHCKEKRSLNKYEKRHDRSKSEERNSRSNDEEKRQIVSNSKKDKEQRLSKDRERKSSKDMDRRLFTDKESESSKDRERKSSQDRGQKYKESDQESRDNEHKLQEKGPKEKRRSKDRELDSKSGGRDYKSDKSKTQNERKDGTSNLNICYNKKSRVQIVGDECLPDWSVFEEEWYIRFQKCNPAPIEVLATDQKVTQECVRLTKEIHTISKDVSKSDKDPQACLTVSYTSEPSTSGSQDTVQATSFYKSQPIIEFMCEVLDILDVNEQRERLPDSQRVKFAKEIKGLKIESIHCGQRRKYRVCNVTRRPARMQCFPLQLEDGQTIECTVAKYFLDKHNMKLKYPHLPCLQVVQEHNYTYLPLENSSMMEVTAQSVPDCEQKIDDLIRKTDYDNVPYVQKCKSNNSDGRIEASRQRLSPAKLQYDGRKKQEALPKRGVWDLGGKQLSNFTAVEIRVWAIACFAPKSVLKDDLRNFVEQLQKISGDAGMPIIGQPCFCKYATGPDQVEPMFRYLKSTFAGLQLVLVVLPRGESRIYGEVKRVNDTVPGMPTMLVQAITVVKALPQRLSNLLVKISFKLGSVNSTLAPGVRQKVFNEPVIFLGADVTRPPAGNSKKPSIAVVVGSMDAGPSRYSATFRMQHNRQEAIHELSSMVRELLIMFYKSTGGYKPLKIILFRDGLSEEQFSAVLKHELTAIRDACAKLEADYRPGITFIVVQKPNRVSCAYKRKMPWKFGSIPTGYMIPDHITHGTASYTQLFDFYIYSNQSTRGTSRPSQYRVLWNDNPFDKEELKCLTYHLCHTGVRNIQSVSIPVPVYHAHLVAFRILYHLVERVHDSGDGPLQDLSSGEGTSNSDNSKDGTLSKDGAASFYVDTKKVMHFP
ncbi:protein argonaute-4-like isoform X2 [Artemia franciscana]|uniref:protein argonaute-4-like isoform X2 n=1 Tax=Artemia franciscana TaxID=6661 RepID=UPI0032DA7F11